MRQALQELLSEYMVNQDTPGKKLEQALDTKNQKTRDLRRQLRKAVVDHVSDSFLESTGPLIALVEAAKDGRERAVEKYSVIFKEHTSKLVVVANLARV